MNKFFDKVGIEIEGGWLDVKRVHPFFKGDSSSVVPGFFHISQAGVLGNHPIYTYPVCGEINSEPLDGRTKIYKWLKNCYPDGFADATAIHMHVSFPKLSDYAKIMTEHFCDIVIERFGEFGKNEVDGKDAAAASFWKRFHGQNQWSQRGFGDIYHSSKSRAFNFRAFLGDNWGHRKYKTFEFRMMPTFEKRTTAHKGIKLYLDIIKEVLHKNSPPKDQVQNSLETLKTLPTGIPE
jgi:hypothetical protein